MLQDVCNTTVHTLQQDSTVGEAAKFMLEKHVGSLFVVDNQSGSKKPIGVLTDRDIVIKVVAKNKSLDTPIKDVMNTNLITAYDDDGIQETIIKMRDNGVRRIVVLDDQDQLFGTLTVDDLYGLLAKELNELSSVCNKQIEIEKSNKKMKAS